MNRCSLLLWGCALTAPALVGAQDTPASTQSLQNLFAAPESRAAAEPPPAKVVPGFDLKGRWVAVITEDWRYRMVVAPKGEYASIPISAEGKRVADQWDPDKDRADGDACKAYGVGNIMRMPLRLDISQNADGSWRIETDHGQQLRTIFFNQPTVAADAPRTWQGVSVGTWDGNVLNIVTTHMRAGYLRTNGVPYSENAIVTESIIRHSEGAAGEWFTVSTVVTDPTYLREPFVTSSSFKRLNDNKDWKPGPCVSEWGPIKERKFPNPYRL